MRQAAGNKGVSDLMTAGLSVIDEIVKRAVLSVTDRIVFISTDTAAVVERLEQKTDAVFLKNAAVFCFGAAVFAAAAALILFFAFDIPTIFRIKSGIARRQRIRDMEKKNGEDQEKKSGEKAGKVLALAAAVLLMGTMPARAAAPGEVLPESGQKKTAEFSAKTKSAAASSKASEGKRTGYSFEKLAEEAGAGRSGEGTQTSDEKPDRQSEEADSAQSGEAGRQSGMPMKAEKPSHRVDIPA